MSKLTRSTRAMTIPSDAITIPSRAMMISSRRMTVSTSHGDESMSRDDEKNSRHDDRKSTDDAIDSRRIVIVIRGTSINSPRDERVMGQLRTVSRARSFQVAGTYIRNRGA